MNDTIHFDKMHGLGNDFVLIDTPQFRKPHYHSANFSKDFIRFICNRNIGVGCDTLVIYSVDTINMIVHANFFNADGSHAEMCGNAARCLGQLMYQKNGWNKCELHVNSRNYAISINEGNISVNMGRPNFDHLLDNTLSHDFLNMQNEIMDKTMDIACVSIGNPHIVFFSEIEDKFRIYQQLNNRTIFKNGINVSFANVINSSTIELIVFERGVGQTMACGTAACATAYLAYKKHYVDKACLVHQNGGDLQILITDDDNIVQSGSATYVFSGEL